MTLVELAQVVAKENSCTIKTAKEIVKSSMDVIFKTLKTGESVKISGYGVFYTATLKPRNYFKGKRVTGVRTMVRFKTTRRTKWKSMQ